MKIFNHEYKKSELDKKIGDITQLGGIRSYTFNDGPAKGIRALDISTPSGIEMTVLIDRGLDISRLSYKSIPICWKSSTKETSPIFYESRGLEFLRTFYGGFLLTCGLGNIGAPSIDAGEELGEHGRISNTAAENVWYDGEWKNDEYCLWIQGKLRESRVAGDKLQLTRKISLSMSSLKISIEDTVENIGPLKAPIMILYHINIGFPIIDERSEFLSSRAKVTPFDDNSKAGLADQAAYGKPIPEAKNEVFLHDMEIDEDGNCSAAIVNTDFDKNQGIGILLKYNKKNLPHFLQWKSYQHGEYVGGLIPANSLIRGRSVEREEGNLKFIEPGQKLKYNLEFKILNSNEEIDKYRKSIQQI